MAAIPNPQEGDNIQRVTPYLLIVVLCCVLALAIVEAGDASTSSPQKSPHVEVKTRSATYAAQFEGHRVGNQAWQWRWEVWLPDKWARIGACETGYGKRPGDWEWNSGTYQGSFGFHKDSWDAHKPVDWWPDEAYDATPWQQYQTALAIHARYGFSGWGCRNA